MTSKEVLSLYNANFALNGVKNQLPEGHRSRKTLNDIIMDDNDEEVGEDFVIIEETNDRNNDGPKTANSKKISDKSKVVVRFHNIRGNKPTNETLDVLARKHQRNGVRIFALAESRHTTRDAQFLKIEGWHMASAEKSEEDIEKDFLTKECKKQFRVIDEIISRNEDPHDSVEGNDALREIEQAKLRVKQSMAKHAAHGILLFADQEWVTALNLISKSANHIEVSVKLKNRSFELLVIYGPPSNAKKNNTFYETVGTNFFDKNKNKPAIAIGDTNALVDIIKDRKPAKKTKTTKTALALLVKSKGLIDLGRITAPAKSPEWTYEKNIQGGIKLKERLDYAISNAKFWTDHPETVVETDVIMPNMDHAAIEICFNADDKLVKETKQLDIEER
jgi:hypothetical protein